MKICIFTHTFPRFAEDATAPFMSGLANGMAERGDKVFVLAPYNQKFKANKSKFKLRFYKYVFPDFLHQLGYSQTLRNDMQLKTQMWLLSPLLFIFGFISLYRLVKKEKIDVINAHWILPNGVIAGLVSLITRVPLVSTLPGSDVYIADRNVFYRLLAKLAYSLSNAITSNSQQLIDDLIKIVNDKKNSKKTKVIVYGVDAKKFKLNLKIKKLLKEKLSLKSDELIVLAVGRMVAKKGFVYLINSLPSVINKHKRIKVVLIGDGDQTKELVELVKRKKVEKYVIFLGQIDYKQLPNYYNLGDIFILPSIRDKAGNLDDQSVSVIEAMSSGLPIVTTDFPGYRNVIDDKVNGFLIPEKNSKMIGEKINILIDNKKLRIRMGRNNQNRVKKLYNWKAIGHEYTNLFKSLIK